MSSTQKYEKRLNRMLSRYGKIDENLGKKPSEPSTGPRSNYRVARSISDKSNNEVSADEEEVEMDATDSPRSSVMNGTSDKVLYSSKEDNVSFVCDIFSDSFDDDCKKSRFTERKLKNPIADEYSEILPSTLYRNNRFDRNFIWRWTGLKFMNKVAKTEEHEDHVAVFTYWLMFVEIIVMLLILFQFGFGYSFFSFSKFLEIFDSSKKVSDVVWHQSNTYQPVTYYDHKNFWLGPSYSVLINQGAKFTPCMRQERSVWQAIQRRVVEEGHSGCCIRLDRSGCAQTVQSQCSNKTSFWLKWSDRSGPVCGQDPKYCLKPKVDKGLNKITDWPICYENNITAIGESKDTHMKCHVLARPCCVGIYGKCTLASREYCHFVKGKYHQHATLCSQVNCLRGVCGLTSFKSSPFQIYRLFLSLFVHAGILQLAITLFVQFFYMRRVENFLGTRRTMTLYFISGLGGNLASATFLPITPEVGPHGALCCLISCQIYFVVFAIRHGLTSIKQPYLILCKKILVILLLLALGFFIPFVDNFANIFGTIFGLIAMFIINPLGNRKYHFVPILLLLIFTGGLFYLFFNQQLLEGAAPYFKYLNCLPIFRMCSNIDIAYQEINALN